MAKWDNAILDRVASAKELEISSRRADGTLSRPVTIWSVRVGEDLFVRSVYGEKPWYNALKNRGKGHISAGDVDLDVTFQTPVTDGLDQIDQAYWDKYSKYPGIVPGCVNETARSTTIKVTPA